MKKDSIVEYNVENKAFDYGIGKELSLPIKQFVSMVEIKNRNNGLSAKKKTVYIYIEIIYE